MKIFNFAVVIPMANESQEFNAFTTSLTEVLDNLKSGSVYFVVDNVSVDNTLDLCNHLFAKDKRFNTIWAPENKNVVDAYMRGYKEALDKKHEFIIEMDAGLSHDPKVLPAFIKILSEGKDCVFGSRFIKGGSIYDSSWKRTLLSKTGTTLSNALLGTRMYDMTSGYQGFQARVVKKFLEYKLLSTAHFYQTELRYLLRKTSFTEIPIQYKAPSPSVSWKAIYNSITVLLHYVLLRLKFNAPFIK
jgi:dolichol-phosphate mannosyltransferase